MLRFLGYLVLALVVVAAGLFVRTLWNAGWFDEVPPDTTLACTVHPAPDGPEDIVIDRASGMVFVSAYDRRRAFAGEPVRGDIYALHFAMPGIAPAPVTVGAPGDFRPHGISLYAAPDGTRTLMAISHPAAGGHKVEIFDLRDTETGVALVHRRTVTAPEMISPNDLAATGPDSFYFANDHTATGQLTSFLESYLALPWGNVGYFDGMSARIVADGFQYPNGIALSEDGAFLYVAETTGASVASFARDPATNALTARVDTPVGIGLDNIDLGDDGALWIAAHPKLLDFVAHAGDPAKPSPGAVWRVPLAGGRPGTPESIWRHNGTVFSGSSVGAYANGRLFIGAVFAPNVVVCDM